MRFKLFVTLAIALLWLGDPLSAASLTTAPLPDVGGLFGRLVSPELVLGLAFVALGVTLDTGALTLADYAKRRDPDGKVAAIIELLMQKNQVLEDMPFREGNLPVGDLITQRTGLPEVFFRLINQPVPVSRSHTAQIVEQTAMLEAYSSVDQDLAELEANLNAFRLSEAKPFIESMNQRMAQTLFYGSAANPAEFVGLAPRYSALTGAGNSDNVIDGGGDATADNTSIWLIAWGEEQVCGIYPKGSMAGLKHKDLGLQTAETNDGVTAQLMQVYRDHWQWKVGLAVKNWEYAVRIANIDVTDLEAGTDPPDPDLLFLMAEAIEHLPDDAGNGVFYCNRTIRRWLRHQSNLLVTKGGGVTYENIGGKRVMVFGETPVRRVDVLLNTEEQVT